VTVALRELRPQRREERGGCRVDPAAVHQSSRNPVIEAETMKPAHEAGLAYSAGPVEGEEHEGRRVGGQGLVEEAQLVHAAHEPFLAGRVQPVS
jgi:hypothetical protein